ncbi:AAA family ATPase [Streptomyces sp. NPDC004609]|uniref:AAA family ATPase n=1 Tax=Streptomyces sp. NPDC004609 TaxID=3364704 RepID=UPI003688B44B
MARRVRRITVSGYKSIREAGLDLGPVTLLVGPNGAGKSNFIEAVELLGRIADGELRMEVGLRGGAEAMLHDGAKGTARIRLRLEAGENHRSNVYEAVLVPAAQGELIFKRETLEFHDTRRFEQPWTESLGQGHRESKLTETAAGGTLAMGGVARHTLEMLRGCRVYHFHDTTPNAPVKQAGYTSDSEALHPDARNLAAFLLRLREEHPTVYRKIVRTVRSVAPFFRDFVLSEDTEERVRLRWKQTESRPCSTTAGN